MAYPPRPAYFGTGLRPPRPPRPRQPFNPLAGIYSNPAVQAAKIAAEQGGSLADRALNEQRSQALIDFGDPAMARGLGVAVDPNAAAAAQANPYSVMAQLARQNQDATRGLLNNLAGTGMLHSGATGFQQGKQALAYGQAQYGASQNLLAQLGQYLNQNLQTKQQGTNAYIQALLAALGSYGQNPVYG